MRDFFRFSIREFLVLVICFAVCVAVNRRNDFSSLKQVRLPPIGDLMFIAAPPILLALVLILIHQVRNTPRPPAR